MSLTAGTRLGSYEVLAPLGAGGMGEVYRARDTRLKREVALKILPEAFSRDPDRLARFQREAELLASLNHPNIAAIYGLEEADGLKALVMELVEGPTLAERIVPAGLPLEDALPIAKQITDALEAAHDRGVIHRDLKPANIKITLGGVVKVLDFGLAKLNVRNDPNDPNVPNGPNDLYASQSPTLSMRATREGVILGTAAYMSPEQARGKPVDRRTDIWAFGCVLFEMLSGTQAFAAGGDTLSDTIAAILKSEPEWTALPASVPVTVRRLLRRCLAKDPRDRLRDIADARLEIEETLRAPAAETDSPQAAAIARHPARQSRRRWAVTAGLALLTAALAVPATLYFRQPPPERLTTRLDLVMPPGLDPISLALSPDGRQLAFVAAGDGAPRLWLRPLDQTAARPLPGTDGASYPFWSPDGESIGFFANGALRRLDLTGGVPQTIAPAPAGRGGTWGNDGAIVFAPTNGAVLMRVPSSGGAVTAVTQVGHPQGSHRWPQFLPDGRRFLFSTFGGSPLNSGTYLGSLDGGEPTHVITGDSAGVHAPPNRLLLVREGTLTALPFDPTGASIDNEPVPLAQAVGSDAAQGRGAFSVSATGVITYSASGGSQRRQLVWRDRMGRALGTFGGPDDTNMPSIALDPDGRRLVTARTTQGGQDVWMFDVNRGVPSRFTFDPAADNAPTWSSDGQYVVFRSNRNGTYDLFQKPASGAGAEQPLLDRPEVTIAYDASADGRTLLFGSLDSKTGADIWALPLNGDRKPFPVVQTGFAEDSAEFSPDGQWIAYESNETGRFEIYAQGFPTARGKWQVSTAGGIHPRWRADGTELFYVAPDGRLMAVPLALRSDGQSIEPGTPAALFMPRFASGGTILVPGALARPLYDVAADGRFLLNEAVEDTAAAPLTIILNWDAEID